MMPPPSAVVIPSVTTPTMSSWADRTAVSAPFRANAKTRVRSRTSSGADSDLIPGADGRARPWDSCRATSSRSPLYPRRADRLDEVGEGPVDAGVVAGGVQVHDQPADDREDHRRQLG